MAGVRRPSLFYSVGAVTIYAEYPRTPGYQAGISLVDGSRACYQLLLAAFVAIRGAFAPYPFDDVGRIWIKNWAHGATHLRVSSRRGIKPPHIATIPSQIGPSTMR